MALTWVLFVLALAGWLAVTAVIWTVLYSATKQWVTQTIPVRDRHRRDDGEESPDSPA